MKLLGEKRYYFASLFDILSSVLWSVVFFYLLLFAVREWLFPSLVDFFPSFHIFLKQNVGENYSSIVFDNYLLSPCAIFALLLGMRFGFRSSKKRRAEFFKFTNGIIDARSALKFHYKSYGIMDFLSSVIVSAFVIYASMALSINMIYLVPHLAFFTFMPQFIASSEILQCILGAVLLSASSVYGVYSSHRVWCAQLLYDME